jgi:hypothetical protein
MPSTGDVNTSTKTVSEALHVYDLRLRLRVLNSTGNVVLIRRQRRIQ